MEFFLTGVAETAEQAVGTARELITMFEDHRQKIAGVGRVAPTALRVHELMQAHPIVTIQTVSERLGISFATAGAALEKLTDISVARETTGPRRGASTPTRTIWRCSIAGPIRCRTSRTHRRLGRPGVN
jgi:Fic family protein